MFVELSLMLKSKILIKLVKTYFTSLCHGIDTLPVLNFV